MASTVENSDQPSLEVPSSTGAGNPFSNGPFFQRTDWLSFGLTTVVVLVVYLCTLAPEVTLENSGMLTTSAAYVGVPHPPGYPVWTVYSWLFVHALPFFNIAWRVAVGSAVAAALACGLVALMVLRSGILLLEHRPGFSLWRPAEQNLLRVACGYASGMVLGLSSVVWQKAVIADTWALSMLLFSAMLTLLMHWMVAPERRRFLFGAVFLFGLLLTSNQEVTVEIPSLLLLAMLADQDLGRDLFLVTALLAITNWVANKFGFFSWQGYYADYYAVSNVPLLLAFMVVAVAALVTVIRTRRVGSEWKAAILCAPVLLMGLACCFYLPLASMTNPPMNWGYARTVEGFFHVITRGQYERPHATDDLGQFIGQLWAMAKETGKGFGWFYLPLAVLPFCLLGRAERTARTWLLSLVAVFVGTGPLMVALLNPPNDLADLQYVAPYFCALNVVLAIWVGLGLSVVGGVVAKGVILPRAGSAPVP